MPVYWGRHTQSEPRTVAQVVADDLGLAVDELDCALGAGGDAGAAAIAQVLIDFDDLPLGHSLPLGTESETGGCFPVSVKC